ncbi:MAG TPA: YciI family protein [Gemmatimonadales bacterium]|nr:YciI family protein [Gemmatimonadales bacterium]
MQYILLIYDNEQNWANLSEAERNAMYQEYGELGQSLAKSGRYKAGEELKPTATATTVRVRNGKVQTTDGPFAETREQLGGFYLVEAKDLDDAIAVAARIPSVRNGCVEVRPINPHP